VRSQSSVVCIPTTVTVEEDLTYEIQQAYRIFHSFLLEKHKGITTPFLHPIGLKDHTDWAGGHHKQSMCFRRMEEKFVSRAYETITDFVADFRLMLENCYRHHGVDHWISKQAQKLEIMLEQKLTLLSRTLREKTSLALTSKGRFGTEDERGPVGTSTRRRSVPRSLATITVGGNESIMVQALRLEEQQRVKEEKRQRELEKKEAEETSAKEVEEWERSLLSQASETPVKTLWELPAIGHFLCLAQAALNLPEIVFFELERCLLMPRCSIFLSKVMSSLLCQPQRRGTLHRRPALSYRCWEFELRKRVQGWYYAMGTAEDQGWMAEQLGLSHQFFRTVGEVSPLENNPFHLLPFIQRVWLLKGLCDNVYETQKEVQDAVLGQPIHECRESILGYDGNENAYIHFPHFCGADLRIYCQSASLPPEYPLPVVWVKRVEPDEGVSEDSDEQKHSGNLVSMGDEEYEEKPTCDSKFKGENGGTNRDGSLEELRELINKTEDELDELESTKKRSGKWYVRREAVKDLHITLIRLLNELSPWEPKLVKAFHRNRLRLKKDYDDFRKHPDYDNFVREEWVAEDMDRHPGDQLTEEEDYQELDKTDQRILWTGGKMEQQIKPMLTLNEHRPSTRGLKRLQSGIAEELSVIKRGRIGSEIAASPGRLEMENHPRDGNPAAHQLEETGAAVVTSVTGLQRPYKPIQLHTLLAKSVGNKVTLIHHQPGTSVITTRTQTQTVNTAPIPKSPVKVVYKMPEGLGQVRKDGSPVKIAVQPVLDQKTGDEIMQRVVILPSNLLIQKSEDKIVSQHARTSSKASTPLSKSSRVTVPQNQDSCISIQQVAPLKGMSPSPTVSPRLQTSSTPGFNVVRLPDPKASSTIQNVIPNRSPSNPTSAVSNDPSKPLDPNQELKTVCIRDSQSILVTTRGGNTGVVKVQTSNQGTPGSLPASPVITISPQFKAFLVSKTSPPAAPTVPVLTSSTLAQAQSISQLWSSTGTSSTTPRKSPITAGIPVTAGSNVAISQGFPVSSKLAVNSQLPESSITVPGKPAGATQTSLVHCVPKPVLKRVNPDEMCTFTKFILVSSSSNITNKVTSTTATSALPGQRVVFISQSPSTGCIPKTTTSVSGATTQSVTTSMPNEALKIGVNIGQAISSTNFGALNKVQSINLLSGSQMRLPLQANLSKPVSAPVRSTLKSTSPSASKAGLLATTTSQVVSSTAHLPSSTLLVGSQVQGKPISSIIKGLIPCNSQQAVPVTTPLSPVKTSPLTPLAQVSQSQNSVGFTAHAQSLSTSQSPAAPRSCQQSSPVRSAVNTNAVSSTTVQQKIVINTSAPLAGGTQILLNNTRFVVPPQGLRPGQHILIISSPAVPVITPCPGGVNPTTGVPRRSALPGLAPPAQGPRMAAPPVTHKAQQAALKSPTLESLSTAEIRPSVPVSFNVPRQMMAVRGQLLATSTATNSSLQVSHQLTGPTVGLANVVAAPPLTLPERMATFAPSSVQGSLSTAQTAVVSQTATKQLPLHTGIGVNGTLKTQQLATLVQPTRAVSTQMQVLPTVAVPPIGSTVSKMQPLAVVTVPPIGSAISSKQASPLATVPQSNCTVIMTPAQPIRTIMSAETIRMPIVLSNPLQQHTVGPGKPTLQNLQIPALAAQTTSPTTKLLVSPDGAVLNMVRGPMTHTGLTDVTKKPLAALIVTPSSTGIVLPPPTIKTGNPSMPNPTDSSGPIS
uniref:Bromo domain-containing protein n=1 Tax=Esox lucius TaxID=8010 RepID=A0A6Q2Y2U6_ESOLU